MRIEIIEQRILTADEGMYLTDGETIARTVVLGKSADATAWSEITEAEKEEIEAQEVADNENM